MLELRDIDVAVYAAGHNNLTEELSDKEFKEEDFDYDLEDHTVKNVILFLVSLSIIFIVFFE
ncbi:MAG: hypothetical protein RRZ70_03675 [Synergistaceae bacterium]